MMRTTADKLATAIARAGRIAVLTGAGISTESGLPDFRSQDGLWRRYRPEMLANLEALRERPQLFYEFYRYRLQLLRQAAPNPAHKALADLERQGRVEAIVTQNVDGFHAMAGSRNVIELHGTLRRVRCQDCSRVYPSALLEEPVTDLAALPRCACGGLIRPGVVLFGEMLPEQAMLDAYAVMERCEGLLIVGSSLLVHPAAGLPAIVRRRNKPLWIINLSATPYDDVADLVIRERAGDVLPGVADRLAGAAEAGEA